jgi:uncharacterized 2Fe-2S/4Fe-4S cluster protein (DUF4445 family)
MSNVASVTVVEANGNREISCNGGETLLEVLIDGGITQVLAPCGGNGLCGKCLVKVLDGPVSEVTSEEVTLLGAKKIAEGYRLACRAHVPKGASMTIALVSEERLAQIASNYTGNTGTYRKVERQSTNQSYGCAVDIGTTTIVVYLVQHDETGSEVIGHRSALNAQRSFGGDVISRIQYTEEHNRGLVILQKAIVNQLDSLIGEMLEEHKIEAIHLKHIIAVGNPTMIHLLIGAPVAGIARAPFIPHFTQAQQLTVGDLGFKTLFKKTQLILPGNISAYVGSDITAGLHAVDITSTDQVTLYIDIGTNGEIALYNKGKLYCCSAAAGPAFEGASISCGMGAVAGAIDHLWMTENKVSFSTIAGEEPLGICGSGIIDTVAMLLDTELVDETGAMVDPDDSEIDLIIETDRGSALKITQMVHFNSHDVREVQLAKAAIAAGIQVLLHEAQITSECIERVMVAGGFGAYINLPSAQRIGLLPNIPLHQVTSEGNCAGKGALLAAMDESDLTAIEQLRDNAYYIELSTSSLFQQLFIDLMLFD